MSRRPLDDSSEFTCSIPTRDAVGPTAAVHNRMPVAVPKVAKRSWLDPVQADAAKAIELARNSAITQFVYHAVNQRASAAWELFYLGSTSGKFLVPDNERRFAEFEQPLPDVPNGRSGSGAVLRLRRARWKRA